MILSLMLCLPFAAAAALVYVYSVIPSEPSAVSVIIKTVLIVTIAFCFIVGWRNLYGAKRGKFLAGIATAFRAVVDWVTGANIPPEEFPMMSADSQDPDHIRDYIGI